MVPRRARRRNLYEAIYTELAYLFTDQADIVDYFLNHMIESHQKKLLSYQLRMLESLVLLELFLFSFLKLLILILTKQKCQYQTLK